MRKRGGAWSPRTEPISEGDAESGFTCGQPALDDFLARHAVENDRKGIGKTYVLRSTADGDPPVLGFYTLSMADVAAKVVRKALRGPLPRYPMPVALMGRLAVHKAAQGRGLGQVLLVDALHRILAVADHIGCVGVIVDAKDEAAEGFYRRYGFVTVEAEEWPHRMFLPLKTAKISLSAPPG